jgi:hypothetical protein
MTRNVVFAGLTVLAAALLGYSIGYSMGLIEKDPKPQTGHKVKLLLTTEEDGEKISVDRTVALPFVPNVGTKVGYSTKFLVAIEGADSRIHVEKLTALPIVPKVGTRFGLVTIRALFRDPNHGIFIANCGLIKCPQMRSKCFLRSLGKDWRSQHERGQAPLITLPPHLPPRGVVELDVPHLPRGALIGQAGQGLSRFLLSLLPPAIVSPLNISGAKNGIRDMQTMRAVLFVQPIFPSFHAVVRAADCIASFATMS